MGEEKELKCQFKESDREKIERIVIDVLKYCGMSQKDEALKIQQIDQYVDTQDYQIAKSGESLRIREKNGKIKGTYKRLNTQTDAMFDRSEMEVEISEKTVQDLVQGIFHEHQVQLPQNMQFIVEVQNERVKQDYTSDEIDLELAFDKVRNTDLKSGKTLDASLGEFELEVKSESQQEQVLNIIKKIWISILAKCTQEGIQIKKSKYNKYVSALIDLGLLEDKAIQIER